MQGHYLLLSVLHVHPEDVVQGEEIALNIVEVFAASQSFLRGIHGGVAGVGFAHQLDGAAVGRGVPDGLAVELGNVGAAEEVDELLSVLLVLGALGDDHAVHPHVAAFLGNRVGQIGVQVDGILGIARPDHGQSGFASHHLILGFVHLIGLDHAGLLLLDQLGLGFFQSDDVVGVHGVAQILEGHAHGVADAVQHEHVVSVLGVPQDAPGINGIIHHLGVVQDTHGAPHVGNGVSVVGVIAGVEQVGQVPKSFKNIEYIRMINKKSFPVCVLYLVAQCPIIYDLCSYVYNKTISKLKDR